MRFVIHDHTEDATPDETYASRHTGVDTATGETFTPKPFHDSAPQFHVIRDGAGWKVQG